jgi:hypothetical protein
MLDVHFSHAQRDLEPGNPFGNVLRKRVVPGFAACGPGKGDGGSRSGRRIDRIRGCRRTDFLPESPGVSCGCAVTPIRVSAIVGIESA